MTTSPTTLSFRAAALAATLALAASTFATAPAEAAPADGKYYSSCDALHRDFKHGVARSKKAGKKQVRDGYGMPAYGSWAKKVYAKNSSRLDRDDDGTACEA